MKVDFSFGSHTYSILLAIDFIVSFQGKASCERAQGCVGSRLSLRCPEMKVIQITAVVLGDSKCLGKSCCIKDNDCTHNANADHTMDVHRRCDNKQNCIVDVLKAKIPCGYFSSSNNDFERITYNCMNVPQNDAIKSPTVQPTVDILNHRSYTRDHNPPSPFPSEEERGMALTTKSSDGDSKSTDAQPTVDILNHRLHTSDPNPPSPSLSEEDRGMVETTNTSDKICNEDTEKDKIHWGRTPAETVLTRPCPRNGTGSCSRKCRLDNDNQARWSQSNCNSCVDKEFEDLLKKIENVEKTKDQRVIVKIASDLSVVTNKSEGLSPGNLNASVRLINRLADLKSDTTVNTSAAEIKSIVQAASNILQVNNSNAWKELENENKSIATSILFSLDVYGRSLSDISEHSIEMEDSLVLQAWSYQKSGRPHQIEFPNGSLWGESRGDGISISMDALNSENQASLKMWGSYYRTVDDYLPLKRNSSDKVNSRVLSFSIGGLMSNETLKHPVVITLHHNEEKRIRFQRTCSFWNFDKGDWDSAGCLVTSTNKTHTICSCNHLTNFAVLMSLKPSEDKLLSILSIIGCSISIAALILTIIVYAVTWKQAKSAQATVLLNLCVALIIAYVIFLTGADKFDKDKYSEVGCQAVAVLLHYFFLVAFFIMLIEGVELVLYIIFVFHVRRTRETIMLIAAAWVLPLIIVGVSLGSSKLEGYGHETACWLSAEKGLIWAFVGPVLSIITINFVILIIVLRWMSQKKALLAKNAQKRDEIRATLWNLSVTCPVLGLGWLFGIFSVAFDHTAFEYLFVIANSIQGLLIFIFHALFHNKKMNEKITSFYSNYICRCRKSDLSVSTQMTLSQDQTSKGKDRKGLVPKAGKGKQGNFDSAGTQFTSFSDSETLESKH